LLGLTGTGHPKSQTLTGGLRRVGKRLSAGRPFRAVASKSPGETHGPPYSSGVGRLAEIPGR
jgi:hypothetical protein